MINTTTPLYFTQIYLITNCYGNPNKVYIGKERSHKLDKRINQHKRIYGQDIIFTYIDLIDSWESKDWKSLECYWIEQFKQWGFDIQNKNKGGGGPYIVTDITKLKISQANKGRSINKGISKPKDFGNKISQALKGKKKSQISSLKKSKALKGKIKSIEHKQNIGKSLWKITLQYDLNNNLIQEYTSLKEASNITKINIRSISNCCLNKTKTAGGYKWIYKEKLIKIA